MTPARPTVDVDGLAGLAEIIWTTSRADEGTISATGANHVAGAVLAAGYATPEQVARLKRGARTLGGIVDKQCQMVLDITGAHDLIDEDGDGDWGAVWDRLAAVTAERDEARAAVERVREVCELMGDPDDPKFLHPQTAGLLHQLRAALAPASTSEGGEG